MTCPAEVTYELDPDVGPERIACDLDAGHGGMHEQQNEDGSTSWGKASILSEVKS